MQRPIWRRRAERRGVDGKLRHGRDERALLGTAPDEEVAAQIGRPTNAVRIERNRRGIASACDRRRRRQGTL
jgi:hypothetical protein